MCGASRVSTYGHVEGKAEKVEEYVQLYDDGFVYTDASAGGSGAKIFLTRRFKRKRKREGSLTWSWRSGGLAQNNNHFPIRHIMIMLLRVE